jgi:hypothetical protein
MCVPKWKVMVAWLAFGWGCSRGAAPAQADAGTVVFRYSNSGQTVQVKVDERFEVVLSSRNTPDGRADTWGGSARIDGDAVDWLGKQVSSPGHEGQEGPRLHTFRFVGKRAGSSKIVISNYRREPYELTVQVK